MRLVQGAGEGGSHGGSLPPLPAGGGGISGAQPLRTTSSPLRPRTGRTAQHRHQTLNPNSRFPPPPHVAGDAQFAQCAVQDGPLLRLHKHGVLPAHWLLVGAGRMSVCEGRVVRRGVSVASARRSSSSLAGGSVRGEGGQDRGAHWPLANTLTAGDRGRRHIFTASRHTPLFGIITRTSAPLLALQEYLSVHGPVPRVQESKGACRESGWVGERGGKCEREEWLQGPGGRGPRGTTKEVRT